MDLDFVLVEEKETNELEESLQDMLQGGVVGYEFKDLNKFKEDFFVNEFRVFVLDCRRLLVFYDEFVNEFLNEYVDIEVDYKNKMENKFFFMNYSFILIIVFKYTCMYIDNRVRMYNERRFFILNILVRGLFFIFFLRFRVRRDYFIDDVFVNVSIINKILVEFDIL